jgi:hypothetical protein
MADMDKTIGQIAYEAASKYDHDPIPWDDPVNKDLGYQVDWEAAASAVWDQAVEACADRIEKLRDNTQQLKLHMGEMEAQEQRTLKAGMGLFAFLLRSLKRSQSQTGTDDLCQASPGIKGETVSAAPLQSGVSAEAEKRESQPAWMEARKIIHPLILHCNGHVDHFGSHCSQCKEATAIVARLIAANSQGQIEEPGTGDEMTAASAERSLTPNNQDADGIEPEKVVFKDLTDWED